MTETENTSREAYRKGRDLMDQKHYEEAITCFEQSIKVSPHFKTLELLGECYYLLGKLNDAIVPLAAAASLNDQVRAKALLSKVLLATGDPFRAKQLANQIISLNPDNKIAQEILAATETLEV